MKRKTLLIGLCIVFAGITLYYGLGLYRQWQEYRAGEQTYEELTQYVQPKVPVQLLTHTIDESHPTEPTPTEEIDNTIWPIVDFEALKAINPDIVAWICIEGTNINYPVVQSDDNNYYINRLFNGNYSKVGSIFMDYRNPTDLSGRNTVLYGHNMQNWRRSPPVKRFSPTFSAPTPPAVTTLSVWSTAPASPWQSVSLPVSSC